MRLVFDAQPGPAVNASLIDMGDRFRLVVNEVDVVAPPKQCPSSRWRARCGRASRTVDGVRGVDLAGGAHHTAFSRAVTAEMWEDFADMAGIEMVLIGEGTSIRGLKQELRSNDVYYRLAQGFAS